MPLKGLKSVVRADVAGEHPVDADVCMVHWEAAPESTRMTRIDESAERLLGFPLERWYEDEFWENQIHPADRERVIRHCRAETLEGRNHHMEYRMVRADGSVAWIYDAVQLRFENGELAKIKGVFVEISPRVEASRQLQDREALLVALATGVPAGLYVVETKTGEISYANDRFFQMWGLESFREPVSCQKAGHAELLADCARRVKDPETFRSRCNALTDPQIRTTAEYEVPLADGRLIALYTAPIRNVAEGGARLFVFRDVTEERRIRTELQNWKDRYEAACAVSGHMLYEWTPGTNELTLGKNLEKTLGWEHEYFDEDPGRWLELIHPEDRSAFDEMRHEIEQGAKSCRVEYRVRHKDGTYRWVEGHSVTMFDGRGQAIRSVGFVADLTERKRADEERRQLEEQRQRAQRLESVAILAGGIAHDFNNMLTVITGNTSLAADALPTGSPQREQLQRALQSADRARDLVRQILTFSRQTPAEMRVISIGPIVEEAVALARSMLPDNVALQSDITAEEVCVRADESQIHSVAVNLMANARQALGDGGGHIRVRLDVCDAAPETQEAVLLVSDDGPGMTEHVKARIFEPFFTTKAPGAGSGLGMAVAHEIVNEHGGRIEVDSAPGEGTEFRVYLTVAEGAATPRTSKPKAPGAGNQLRILAVDDQAGVLQVAAGLLEQLGHETVAMAHPEEALERFTRDPDAFDLVLTDLSMPGGGGMELAAKIQGVRPGTPVILVTGFDPSLPAEELRAAGVRFVLRKPFRGKDLQQALGEALAGGASKQDADSGEEV